MGHRCTKYILTTHFRNPEDFFKQMSFWSCIFPLLNVSSRVDVQICDVKGKAIQTSYNPCCESALCCVLFCVVCELWFSLVIFITKLVGYKLLRSSLSTSLFTVTIKQAGCGNTVVPCHAPSTVYRN